MFYWWKLHAHDTTGPHDWPKACISGWMLVYCGCCEHYRPDTTSKESRWMLTVEQGLTPLPLRVNKSRWMFDCGCCTWQGTETTPGCSLLHHSGLRHHEGEEEVRRPCHATHAMPLLLQGYQVPSSGCPLTLILSLVFISCTLLNL